MYNKDAVYKYRETHKKEYNEYTNDKMKKQYIKNKDKLKMKYQLKKEWKKLCDINII